MPVPLANTDLFKPIKVGPVTLSNRLVYAPTTRERASEDFVASDSMLEYYTLRAENNGGLIITEGSYPAPEFGLYHTVPMIKTERQVQAWKKIVDAVHEKGTSISIQLWNLGNAADAAVLKKHGLSLRSASDVYPSEKNKELAIEAGNPVRPLTVPEIHSMIKEYGAAAKRAVEGAGFDIVEVHSAQMYLPDQFINASTNHRTDEYGGTIENRTRYVLEAVDSVIAAVGAEHTGLRLSPYSLFQLGEGLNAKVHPIVVYGYILSELERRAKEGKRIAYVSLVEPDIAGYSFVDIEKVDISWVYELWKGIVIWTGGLTLDPEYKRLQGHLKQGRTLVGSCRHFTSNPDLPERLRKGYPLTDFDIPTFYGPDNHGYLTWSKYGEEPVEDYTVPKALV